MSGGAFQSIRGWILNSDHVACLQDPFSHPDPDTAACGGGGDGGGGGVLSTGSLM